MITVAGLAVWKDYSKAVTLGMHLWTFKITLKGDTEREKKKKEVLVRRVLVSHF